ncbi:MAG: RNase adapter RapZ [Clostridiales bacterium]|nr:RNase adapter RapZ [Clostridiales bacterium]
MYTQFIIVTGMSGAGKSTVLDFLEDAGFYCVDNLPPALIPKFAELFSMQRNGIKQVALGIDVRGGKLFNDLFATLDELSAKGYEFSILFLDAPDDVLVKRYKETRRIHPLAMGGRVISGIATERSALQDLKQRAEFIVDTGNLLTRQLKETINDIIIKNNKFNSLIITVLSFGFKYGIPDDSDLVFDVRFIPNPFYIPEMKELTGLDPLVRNFVMESETSRAYCDKWIDFIAFLIPHYVEEGKNHLVISVGCTGGKHRSVALSEKLATELKKLGYMTVINHRDIDKDAKK